MLFAALGLMVGHINVKDPKWEEKRVYLATYPRSGSHWSRSLIEEATGMATSSVYPDRTPQHLSTIFPWGGYCPEGLAFYPLHGETVVVKTHYPALQEVKFDKLPYRRAVRIVRHPVDSFYSRYQFNEGNRAEDLIPREKLLQFIRSWNRFQEHWNNESNVLTVRYEDLYNNPSVYLRLILETIGYAVTEEDIERAVTKYPPKGGILKHLGHFTKGDLSIIEEKSGDLMKIYGYEIRQVKFHSND